MCEQYKNYFGKLVFKILPQLLIKAKGGKSPPLESAALLYSLLINNQSSPGFNEFLMNNPVTR